MDYAMITVPVAPLRRKPKHVAEMTSQLLYGEAVRVIKTKGKKWLKVRGLHDGYEGWLTVQLVTEIEKSIAVQSYTQVVTDSLATVQTNDGSMHIPRGSTLWFLQQNNSALTITGNYWDTASVKPSAELVIQLTAEWLNAPYLWGGRTILGVDCSGFSQTVFKLMGLQLPRDAWQQAQQGVAVDDLKEARTGDLVFFDDKEEIVHVGILLDNQRVIHASGKVRIDPIDKKGILHSESQKRTHSLRAIRRFW